MNASQISAYSHNDVPWMTTKDGEAIEYESVFYRTPPYSVRAYAGRERMSDPFYKPFIGTLFKKISHVPEFEKDLKKLKRFSSLEEDLQNFIKFAMKLIPQTEYRQ